MSSVRELRMRLTEKQTLYRQSLERAKEAQERISSRLSEIDMNCIDTLRNERGIDLMFLNTLDLERLKTDREYLATVENQLAHGINQLQSYLESELDV